MKMNLNTIPTNNNKETSLEKNSTIKRILLASSLSKQSDRSDKTPLSN